MVQILGVSLVTYKRRETNIFSPDYGTPGKIADYFRVSTDYFFGLAIPNMLTPSRPREPCGYNRSHLRDFGQKEVSQNENGHENKAGKKDGK